MKSTIVSNAALLSQLVLVSAGLALAGPAFGGQANQPPETASTVKLNKGDRDLTQEIRKSIVSDKSLSAQAHNVKILTKDGMVTLKGQVKTDEEKKAIEDKAYNAPSLAPILVQATD